MEKIKVLALGHAYHAFRQFLTWENIPDNTMELTVLTVDNWPFDYGEKSQSNRPNVKFIYLPAIDIPKPDYYMIGFEKIIKNFAPEILIIMQEPHQKQTTLALDVAKDIKCKTVLFSWENLNPYLGHPNWSKIDYFVGGNNKACHFAEINGIKKENITRILQAGVCTDMFKEYDGRKELMDDGWINVLFSSRLTEGKGLKEIIEAMRKIFQYKYSHKVVFTCTGFTNDIGENLTFLVKNFAKEYPGRVRISNHKIPYPMMPKIYNNAHITIGNSKDTPYWSEQSLNYSCAEAAACGCAPIMAKSGAISEYWGGSGAILIDWQKNNVEALTDALDKLIRDDNYRRICACESKKNIINNYSHKIIAMKYRTFFKKIYENK